MTTFPLYNIMRKILYCFVLMLLHSGLCGQSIEDSLYALPEVEVSQSRLPKNGTLALNTVALDSSVISFNRGLALGDVLANTSDVFVASTENFSQDMRISIRGFGMRSAFGIRGIKLVYDGLPESTADGQGDVDNIDPSILSSVKIFKGPANGIYSNATGGVIEMESIWPQKELEIDVDNTIGSYGLIKSRIGVGMKKQNSRHLWSVGGLKYDGFREHSSYRNFNFLFKSLFIMKRSSLLLIANGFNSPRAYDPGGITLEQSTTNPRSARAQNIEFFAGEKVQQQKLGLTYKLRLSKHIDWNTSAFIMSRSFENKLPFVNGAAVFYDRLFVGGNSYLSGGKKLNWKIGIDVDAQRDARERYDNLKTDIGPLRLAQDESFKSVGGFLVLAQKFNKLDLSLNLRQEFIDIGLEDKFLDDGDQSSSINYLPWSGGFGASYQITSILTAHATLSSGFETPTLTEISNNPSGPGFANIDPARSINKELGLSFNQDEITMSANLYHITSSNELLPYELPQTPGRLFYRNAGKSKRMGIEYHMEYKIGSSFDVALVGNFNRMAFENIQMEDKNIPGLPSSQHQFRLSKSFDKYFQLAASIRYQGQLFADDVNAVVIKPVYFSGINIASEFDLGKLKVVPSAGWQYALSDVYYSNIFINAAGARYYEPGPKSNLFVSLKLSWGK